MTHAGWRGRWGAIQRLPGGSPGPVWFPPTSRKACGLEPAAGASLIRAQLLARGRGLPRQPARCSSPVVWRATGGLQVLGRDPVLPKTVAVRERGGGKAPFLGVSAPGGCGTGAALCHFLLSPLGWDASASLAGFSFLFPFALSFGRDFNIYHRLVG